MNSQGDNRSSTASLIQAAQNGRDKCIGMLIQGGADVNIQSKDGYTALMFAEKKDDKCVDVLVKSGS